MTEVALLWQSRHSHCYTPNVYGHVVMGLYLGIHEWTHDTFHLSLRV